MILHNFYISIVFLISLHNHGLLINCAITNDEIKIALDFHNELRASVYPTATSMRRLTWSTRLQTLAQQASDRCLFEHNYGGDYASLGENIYIGYTDIKAALMLFFIERENFNLTTNKCGIAHGNGLYPNLNTCGHYIQLTSALISELGCGKTMCSGRVLIFCEYDRIYSSPPYQAGPSCSDCPAQMSWCHNNLCVTHDYKQSLSDRNNATCSVICKDCYTKKIVNNNMCVCDREAGTVPTCSKCSQLGTYCVHGTDRNSSSVCECNCTAGYQGQLCTENKEQMQTGFQLRIAGDLRSQSYYPTPTYMWEQIKPSLTQGLSASFNHFCSNSTNFELCCPGVNKSIIPLLNNYTFVTPQSFILNDQYPKIDITGELVVVLVVKKSDTDAFCGRNNTSSSPGYIQFNNVVNGSTLLSVIKSMNETVSNFTLACCSRRITVVTTPYNNTPIWPTYSIGPSPSAGGGGGSSGGGTGGGGSTRETSGNSKSSTPKTNTGSERNNSAYMVSLIGCITTGAIAVTILIALLIIFFVVPHLSGAASSQALNVKSPPTSISNISRSESVTSMHEDRPGTPEPDLPPAIRGPPIGLPMPDGPDPPPQFFYTQPRQSTSPFLPFVSD